MFALALSLAYADAARAEPVTAKDDAGRDIRFDVLVPGVTVDRFAEMLRSSAHGNEIATMIVTVVSVDEMHARCGSWAAACRAGASAPTPARAAHRGRSFVVNASTSSFAPTIGCGSQCRTPCRCAPVRAQRPPSGGARIRARARAQV